MSNSAIVNMPRRFDYSSSTDFNESFSRALNQQAGGEKVVTLDCSQMDYIDSAGIGLLVMSHKKAQTTHAKMAIVNLKPSAREVLLLANLQKIIEIK